MSEQGRVVVVGGGWAGMAAALELTQHHIPVTLYESAQNFGGRARTVSIDGLDFDNGQHLLIGAYRETLRQLFVMGIAHEKVLARLPLHLEILNKLRLTSGPLPAPLHLLWGLLSARSMVAADRYRAIRMSLRLAMQGYQLQRDISVAELLEHHRQSAWLIENLWEPLCLATLNTSIDIASAQVFLKVLQDSFSHRRHDADLLIPKVPLGELFCGNAANFVQNIPGNQLHRNSKVSELLTESGKLTGLKVNGEALTANEVILATPPHVTTRLLQNVEETHSLSEQLAQFDYQPIATVYLYYSGASLPFPMLGLSGTVSQWVFDRTVCGQTGWFAVVISAEGEHSAWDKGKLAEQVQQELAEHLTGWPQRAEAWHVIREKRATFSCHVGIEAQRPASSTPLEGLWLAGDYTNTGYPATLEGAVRSGVQCARRIIARRQQPNE